MDPDKYRPSSAHDSQFWTTNSGAPLSNNNSSLTVGTGVFPDPASPNVISTRSTNMKPNDPKKSLRSPSLSCSHDLNSSQNSSSKQQRNLSMADVNGEENNIIQDDVHGTQIRRVKSHGELNRSSAKEVEETSKLRPRSQSHKSFDQDLESLLQSPKKPTQNVPGEGRALRIKASSTGDKVRFQLQPHWGLSELWRELAMRFNIEVVSIFDLKYLDNDSKWILLMSDANLTECMDLCKSSRWDTMKLSVEASHQSRRLVSSWGSNSGFM